MARPRNIPVPGTRPAPVGRPHAVRHLVARAITGYAERVVEDPMTRYPGALLGTGFVAGPALACLPTSWAVLPMGLAATGVVGAEVVAAARSGSYERAPWAAAFLAIPTTWTLYLDHVGLSAPWPWPFLAYPVLMTGLLVPWSLRRSGGRRSDSEATTGDVTKQFRKALAIPAGGRMVRAERADGRGFTLTLDIGPGDDSTNLTADWLTNNFTVEKVARALRLRREDAERILLRPLEGYGEIVLDVMNVSPWAEPVDHPAMSGPMPERTSRDPWQLGVDPAAGSVVEVPVFGSNGDGSHMLIVGRSGSGKSVLLDGLLEHLTACTDVKVWLADAGKCVVTRTWGPAVERVALRTGREGLEELAALLDELDAERVRRAALDPAERALLPRIAFVLDEAPQALGEEREKIEELKDLVRAIRSKVVSLVQTARSEGISLIIASQRGTKAALGTTDISTNIMTKVMMAVGDQREQSMILGGGWRAEGVPALFGLDVAKGRAWVQSEYGRSQARGYLLPAASVAALARSRACGEQVAESPRRSEPELALPWPTEGAAGWPVLESTPEAHFWAAVLRSRDGELREMLGQYRESAGGRDVRFDFYLPSVKVAVEIDGKAYHSEVSDAERDRQMSKIGIVTVRFPARDVMRDADACVRAVVETVRHRGEPGQQWPKVPASGGTRAVEAYRRLLSAELVPGQHIPTGRAREIICPDDAGRTTYNEIIKEMISAGLLVRVIDLGTGRPYQGKATTFELTKVDALLPA